MQLYPRFYLSKYFDDLKTQIDLYYALKLHEKNKYLEIITKVESFEQEAYKKWNFKRINAYDNEIDLIEVKFNQPDITRLIDVVKYKIESTLLSKKSILFIDEKSRFSRANSPEPFLLIINDEYITKNRVFDHELFTRIELNDDTLKKKLQKKNHKNILELDIDIQNLKYIHYFQISTKLELYPGLLNGLTNLKEIEFSNTNIEEIAPNLFKDLVHLENIDFGGNKIKELHHNLLNGLVNLKTINFANNDIKLIHRNFLKGLENLEFIDFENNKIKKLDRNQFNRLFRLKIINFNRNKIKKMHRNIFNGLDKLESICLYDNEIKRIDQHLLTGLKYLRNIDLGYNLIKEVDKNFFNGLLNLQFVYFDSNQIDKLDFHLLKGLANLKIIDLDENIIFLNRF